MKISDSVAERMLIVASKIVCLLVICFLLTAM